MVESTRRRRAAQAGFSLVELMAVVVITSILATVGVVGFRRYVSTAKGAEAQAIIQAIRAAEESYGAENHVFLDVSTGTNWFPNKQPGMTTTPWPTATSTSTHPDIKSWIKLAPAINRSVQFGYMVNAGVAGAAFPTLQNLTQPGFAAATQNWYVIQAQGDTDGDGVTANFASSSMTGEIYSERSGE